MRSEEKDIKLILNILNNLAIRKPQLFSKQEAEDLRNRVLEI